jgi:heat shock protein HtpX
MGFLRGAFFFGLVNIFVMLTVTVLASVINYFVFGTATPTTGYLPLLVMSCVWGTGGAFISLMMSKYLAKKSMGLHMIDPQSARGQERDLVETVHRLARAAQLPAMPEVGIYESADVNAFATGPSKSNSLVAVSTGLLNAMDREQVEGVLGHEVAHIANGDMVILTLVQGVVNSFVIFFSRILASVVAGSSSDDNRRSGGGTEFMFVMLFQFLFGLLGNMVVCYFSRLREFRADRGGAQFAGRNKMISALQALQAQSGRRLNNESTEPDSYAVAKISNLRGGGLLSLFSTHPSLELRIQKLQQTQLGQ